MNTICKTDLMKLIRTPGNRFVSIYMPTYPAGHEMPQNQIRFRTLLMSADHLLHEKGMEARDAAEFLSPAVELLDGPVFWRALGRGLAVLISTEGMHVWHLPFACDELCVVNRRFHVTPLIGWLNDDAPFWIVAVSQKHSRLLQANHYQVQDVRLPELPTSCPEALHYDTRSGFYQFHSGQPQLRGKEGLVFTGQGGEADVAKAELAEYFGLIDAAVSKSLHERTEPLVFAGVDYLFSIYRQQNSYAHLLAEHVAGNPDLVSLPELRDHAWPLVEKSIRKAQAAEIAKYWDYVHKARATNRVEEIVTAAAAGAVETLFISPAARPMGFFNSVTNSVHLGNQPRHDSEDLANLAAILVLEHGGKVEMIVSGHVPGGGPMAATFRYVPETAPVATSTFQGEQR